MRCYWLWFASAVVGVVGFGAGGYALEPAEIALVAARASRESQALARYYCRVRGVPEENICLVDVPRGEELDHETWRWAVRPEIQKWIIDSDPEEKLRCLVTLWDVPLKIKRAAVGPQLKQYQTFLAGERDRRLELLARARQELEGLAGGTAAGEDAELAGDFKAVQQALERALQAAQQRITKMPAGEERRAAHQRLQQLARVAGGAQVLLQSLNAELDQRGNDAPAALRSQFDLLRGRAIGYGEVKGLLDQMAVGVERDALLLATMEQNAGLLGTVKWLDEQIATAKKNETGASFDSELSLVMWPDDYALLRWQPNYLKPGYDGSQLPKVYRTMMVARLDGPTLPIAKRLIDDAVAVEQEGGLAGKAYIDARGLAGEENGGAARGSYEDFDRSLLQTAEGLRAEGQMEVVLDTEPELFAEGEAPGAAVYCGWYSLGKYVDAFDFEQGAVAYHLASAEARTLRDAESQVWCKRLLEEGVAATIGPVYEPYLVAYPRPDEFFAQLLRSDATLVEVYYRTKPFNSWMMVLLGDPLYRPFGGGDGL